MVNILNFILHMIILLICIIVVGYTFQLLGDLFPIKEKDDEK